MGVRLYPLHLDCHVMRRPGKGEGGAHQKEKLQAVHDGGYTKHGLPVLTQDVEADSPLLVYVGVVHLPEWERDRHGRRVELG